MSYSGISIREVITKLNAPVGGWFLPQVQRQYVWGARYDSETYICLLLDSLLKRYPIGGIVLWETETPVPYREFIKDYVSGHFAREVDSGLWGAQKSLVYDGQQRLQTLYSVLRHRFNGRVLHFDLLFDEDAAEADETGFLFLDPALPSDPRFLRMTELSSLPCTAEEKIQLQDRVVAAAECDPEHRLRLLKNLENLWSVFVDENHKSIAYFSVKAGSPKEVNEVFRRLDTGGVALTQLELVLSKIEAEYSDYEQRLWERSEAIEKNSGGIHFSSTSILQYIYLLIKGTIRIDENSLRPEDVQKFEEALHSESAVLNEFFSAYLKEIFNINHAWIVARWSAVLPMLAYLSARKRAGYEWKIRKLGQQNLLSIHQYFLLSQFCDWNTQTMVNSFARQSITAGESGRDFPITEIRKTAVEKNRRDWLHEYQLRRLPLLATKILLPHRCYVFHENKPQMDHIFPLNLKGSDEDYASRVDVLWNFQPIPAGINNYKRARHPKEFFSSSDGRKYWDSYDFVPSPEDSGWDDYEKFIADRRDSFISVIKDKYDLAVMLND